MIMEHMRGQPGSKRLFENPFLERISRTNAYVVILSFVVLSLLVFIYGFWMLEFNILSGVAIYISGLLVFTLAEYLIHRFVFHSGEYTHEKNWQFKIHGIHHAAPRDKERLAMPLPLAFTVSGIFFLAFWLVMRSYAFFFFPGFILGYALYLFVHYTIQTRRPPKTVIRYLWTHHHVHHHINDHEAFGVTTPFWDIVFRTMPRKK